HDGPGRRAATLPARTVLSPRRSPARPVSRARTGPPPRSSFLFRSLRFRFLEEVVAARGVQQIAGDRGRAALVAAHVDDLLDQVAWMAGAHLNPSRLVVLAVQGLHHGRVEFQVPSFAVALSD